MNDLPPTTQALITIDICRRERDRQQPGDGNKVAFLRMVKTLESWHWLAADRVCQEKVIVFRDWWWG